MQTFGKYTLRLAAQFLLFSALVAPAAMADGSKGYDKLLETAVASDDQATFDTILEAALATWPDDREAILAMAKGLKPEWMEPAQIQEVEEAEARKVAAEEASKARGIIYYLDPSLWNGQAELGATSSTGDSDEQSISMGLSFRRDFGERWSHDLDLNFDLGRNSGETTRQRFVTKYEAIWRPWNGTYAVNYTELEMDKFSGYDYRVIENIGIGYQLIDTDRQKLRFQGGPGIRISRVEATFDEFGTMLSPTMTEKEFLGRISSTYELKLTDSVSFKDRASVLIGVDMTTVENWMELTARINAHLAARFSFEVQYESAPPVGTAAWDTITRAALVYDF
ncbi:Putative salt-induced outer membrane protein YdiY [Kordiimonas lacus]|uniref:Putative salt-induced outer membrane protein YdiY n=2 Tax=Kordiimonas lacus TaxID=637679 RepID=A0A1G6T5N3_9PROT|nr:Putative salt-induced outer membrane protein YdiY [Kordiimonas lacus]